MEYELIRDFRDDPVFRESFFDLARRVFELNFTGWHRAGCWGERYIPYALCSGDAVVANISVNRIDTGWRGRRRRYVQLGTVMTDPAHRGRGLARRLMESVLEEWRPKCDAVYLYANSSVLDFYPRFGFRRRVEYRARMACGPGRGGAVRLDMENPGDREILLRRYRKSNPFSELPMFDNPGLLMFHCCSHLRDSVFFIPEADLAAVAVRDGGTLHCFDLFGGGGYPLRRALSFLADESTREAVLGFTPRDSGGCEMEPVAGDDALFVLGEGEDLFAEHQVRMPELSHA